MSKYEVIKKYIDEFDYYSLLEGGAPQDEFDSYSRELAGLITENDSVEDIALRIAETMDKAFGEEIDPEKFLETAQKVKADLKAETL